MIYIVNASATVFNEYEIEAKSPTEAREKFFEGEWLNETYCDSTDHEITRITKDKRTIIKLKK